MINNTNNNTTNELNEIQINFNQTTNEENKEKEEG